MRIYGFVARWGGEEFLLVFDHSDIYTAYKVLETILTDIRRMESGYDGIIIMVTMTFGLTAGNTTDLNALVRAADEYLYEGKEGGRNRIVWDDPQEKKAAARKVNPDGTEEITEVEMEEEVISLAEADAILREKDTPDPTDETQTDEPPTDETQEETK